jgi:hypothetical protein
VLAVGPIFEPSREPVRVLNVVDRDIFRLRLAGIEAARGEVVAIGEDHALPRADWCEAVIRAHGERPDTPCVVGCLVNATDGTLSGRANFFAFASPFQPPLTQLPDRPAPSSAVSLKRQALEECRGRPGHFESRLLPRLYREGRVEADARIVVEHYQDHGLVWSIVNAFHSARGSYGYAALGCSTSERTLRARWSVANLARILLEEARSTPADGRDLAVVSALAMAAGLGGAIGSLTGPGRSGCKVA